MSEVSVSQPWKANNGGRRYTGHTATGSLAAVDTTPGLSALSGTSSAAQTNFETFTDGTLTQNALLFNAMRADASADNASSWIAQNGLVEIPTGNNKNYTGLLAGDGGAVYHYGTGTITEMDGVIAITQNNSSGNVSVAQDVRALSLNYGSGTLSAHYGMSSQVVQVSGGGIISVNHGFHAFNPTIFSGSIGLNVGLYLESQTAGGTNYNLYSVGATSQNYFEGRVLGKTGTFGVSPSATAVGHLDLRSSSASTTTPLINFHSPTISGGGNTGYNISMGENGDYAGYLKFYPEGGAQDSWSLALTSTLTGVGATTTGFMSSPQYNSVINGRGDSVIMQWTNDGANNFSGSMDFGEPYNGGAAPATFVRVNGWIGNTATSYFSIRSYTANLDLFNVKGSSGKVTLFSNNTTYTATPDQGIYKSGTFTSDYASAQAPYLFEDASTYVMKQTANAFGMGLGIYFHPIFKNDPGVAANLGPYYGFGAQATYQADTQAITSSITVDVAAISIFNRINAGTIVVTQHDNYRAGGTVSAGATVTTKSAFHMIDATMGGTLTTSVGLDVDAQTGGTNIYGYRSALAASGTTRYHLRFTGTALSYWTDGADFEFGTSTGTKFGTATTQKLGWFNATPVIQQTSDVNALVTYGFLASMSNATFTKEVAATIKIADTVTAATAGADLTIVAGYGSPTTSGVGGALTLNGGNGQVGNSNGGAINIKAGTSFGVATGGAVLIDGGSGLVAGTIRLGTVVSSRVGIGVTPTAYLHIKTGSATAAFGQMKFDATTLLTTPEVGVVEFNGGRWYHTNVLNRNIVTATTNTNTTTAGNVGAGEDDLITYAIPANTMATNGDYMSFRASGTIASSVNAKRLRVKYGGTTIMDTGAAGIPISAAIQWVLEAEVIRTGAATQKCNASLTTNNATLATYSGYSTAAETLSGAVTFKLTGEAVSDNDIVQETFTSRLN